MNRGVLLGVLVAVVVGLGLRCPSLDRRPMHNDEAVNAIKFGKLWTEGGYKYDPNEHHGPSLYYATLAVARLTTSPDFERLTETKLRLITVAFGVGLILLLPLVADGLGRKATVWAAFLTAVSPAMVFYSRYYIHEMLLLFFSFAALAAAWRYWRSRKPGWAVLAGISLGLMHATKETFIFALAAAALALGANYCWNRWLDAGVPAARPRGLKPWHLAAALAAWVIVAFVLFTSFFTNAAGLLDSFRTYLPWLRRAEGASPHIHPWTFYLHRLLFFHVAKGPIWSEVFILALALAGAFAAFARKGLVDAEATFIRFLAFYTLALTGLYSLISYKTPWCLLGFWHPTILLAGVGAVSLLQHVKRRWARAALGLALILATAQLAWQAWRAAVPFAADRRNPYVYAQTSPDLLNLVNRVELLAAVSAQGNETIVKVVAPDSDYWPLPWYLRNLKRVGWWDALPADPYAAVMIVSAKLHANLDENKTHVMVGYFQLRPEVFLELYVDLDLWRAYLAKHPPQSE